MIASPAIASKPCVYTTDLNAIISLSSRLATVDLFNIPQNLERGLHVILADKNTPEIAVRQGIYQILLSGNSPEIYQAQQPLAILAAHESLSAGELASQIVGSCQPWEIWLERRSHEKLSLKDAVDLAKIVMAYESEPQRSVKLGTLRMRCDQNSYDWNNLIRKLETEGKSPSGSSNPNISELSLRDRIAEIIDRGLNSSSEKQALLELAKQTFTSPKEIDTLADLVRHEIERDLYREETQKDVSALIKARAALNLADYLPEGLASPVMQWCKWLNIRPEAALSAILVATSSLHETGTNLILHHAQGFSVPATLFMALVAPSGQKKSPIYKNLITKPLKGLKAEAKAKYDSDLKQYEIEYKEWKDDKSEHKGPEPEKPVQRVFYFNSATGEGIQRLAQNCPSKALFMLVDELKGMFDSANQYRSGRGSDRQDILSYYDGAGQTTLRASGVSIDVDEIFISIYGGIQPEVLKTHLKDLKDTDGYWSRFLFVNQQLAASKMGDDMAGFNISELIGGYYRRVYALGKRTYTLSREAFKVYQAAYNDLEQKRVSHPSPGMVNVYAKLEGQIGRLALNLHAIEEVEKNSRNDEISAETMRKAIALANFYLGEVTDLHADSNADKGDLPALLAKLLEYANRKGSLTPRDAVTKYNAIKKSSEALDHFRELEVMGHGVVEKQKRNWVFIPAQGLPNEASSSRNDLLNPESLASQHPGSSRNEVNSSRNGSRNDLLNPESLASQHPGSSRNERNDFSDFSPTREDSQESELNQSKIPPEIITPLRSLHEVVEPCVESEIEPRNDSRNGQGEEHYANDVKPESELDPSLKTPNQNLGCDTPVIASSVQSADAVSKPKKVGLGEWKKGDIANYCGYEVSIYRIDKEDGSIIVRRKDGELINAQECELFRPELKVGDKVEFYNEAVRKKWAGTIKTIKLMDSRFCSATIDYIGFKGKASQVEIFRSDWIKSLH